MTQTKHFITMRKIYLYSVVLFFLFSCENKNVTITPTNKEQSKTIVEYAEDINKANINPVAKEYYQNIAQIAQWYAVHPKVREDNFARMARAPENPDSINTLLEKLKELSITDSLNNPISFFDLNEKDREAFLKDFITIESNLLSEKLAIDTTGQIAQGIQQINRMHRSAVPNLQQRIAAVDEDPYWAVRRRMQQEEKKAIEKIRANIPPVQRINERQFWAALVNHIPHLRIPIKPKSLSPQTFVGRIRHSIKRGRLLISLPGGYETKYPLVIYVYPTIGYDVGHVAIFSKNGSEIPYYVNKYEIISIGANNSKGVHYEEIESDWTNNHSIAFVGQVCKVKWKWKWRGFKSRFVKTSRDVDNDDIYYEIRRQLGKPYCSILQTATCSKLIAPKRFICSSAAWWAAKKGTGVNISSWYKINIWPAGVYLSDNVRIVGNTK